MTRGGYGAGLLAAALAASGCGGPIKPEELSRGVETLASDATEGAFLARDVALDRTRHTFARVYARELGEDVDHEAEKLDDARARPSLAEKKDRAVELAGKISDELGELQISPGDEATGRAAHRELQKLADEADQLSEEL